MNDRTLNAPNLSMLMAPLAAMIYPFLLQASHVGVHMLTAKSAHVKPWAWPMAAFFLLAAFTVPVVAQISAMTLAKRENPTVAETRAKRVALLSVAEPALFTFIGVVFSELKTPISGKGALVVFWGIMIAIIMGSNRDATIINTKQPINFKIRVFHGVSALGILLLFLVMHLSNQFTSLAGGETYSAVMKTFRLVYRAPIIEPIIVGLFLFQIVSGLLLLKRFPAGHWGRSRTLQAASGIYLVFFLCSHLDAVFLLGRTLLNVDTGWRFASNAPIGWIQGTWSIRLVPYYYFAVFAVLSHLVVGVRVVMLGHGVDEKQANRFVIVGGIVCSIVAMLIIAGMCGVRFWNA